jgi:AraC-like DNA-binding protein
MSDVHTSDNRIQKPERCAIDPLSDILTMFTVNRAFPVRFESSGRYAMRFAAYEHVKFSAVLSGEFDLHVDGQREPIRLAAGDCCFQTDGRPYRTFNSKDAIEFDGTTYFTENRSVDGLVRLGEGPPDKVVIGGRFTFDEEGVAWLREALPTVIHVKADAPEAAFLRDTLSLLAREVGGRSPGESVVIGRLADILLIQAIRAHLATAGPNAHSWLAGIADPKIGRALRSFHADVARDWTVASLAAEAGMSRSSFAERFRVRVGVSPLEYLTRWRMARVRRALLDTDQAFATIAERNGYQSRTSCSQSFKRVYGCAPGALRGHGREDSADYGDLIPAMA